MLSDILSHEELFLLFINLSVNAFIDKVEKYIKFNNIKFLYLFLFLQ